MECSFQLLIVLKVIAYTARRGKSERFGRSLKRCKGNARVKRVGMNLCAPRRCRVSRLICVWLDRQAVETRIIEQERIMKSELHGPENVLIFEIQSSKLLSRQFGKEWRRFRTLVREKGQLWVRVCDLFMAGYQLRDKAHLQVVRIHFTLSQ